MKSVAKTVGFVLLHYIPFFLLLGVVSCDLQKEEVKVITPSGNEKYLTNDSNYIFNQDVLHTFEIRLPKSALAKLDANPRAEKYVEGSLIFEGETISPVGIRYKGSLGSFMGALSGGKMDNPKGHKIRTKLSLKIKINWKGSRHKFYGLKKLQFHSLNHDKTQMHDRLGYWLFREMGVPAPRCVHARVVINDIYSGVYALVEQVDKQFIKNNFSDREGNLYKEIWPLNSKGEPYPEKVYLKALKTNEKKNPSARLIQTFAQEIASSNSKNIKDIISMWMDVKMMMAYAAVDRTIRADDGVFHWRCRDKMCKNKNYYWYENPTESRFYLIPWDLDVAFKSIRSEKFYTIPDKWGEITNNCEPFKYYGNLRRSAACDKLVAGWVSFEVEYKEALRQFLEGPFSKAQVKPRLMAWKKQIHSATLEASKAHEDALTMYSWKRAFRRFRRDLAFARKKLSEEIK